MSYTIEVSNATRQNRNLPLRRADSNGNGYLQDFQIPACALNYKLTFDSEDEYKKWTKHYEALVSGKNAIIKIGKASGHSLEKQNKDIEKENANKLKEDQAKIANTDEDAGLKVEVEKVSKDGDKK
ncbi:hypothetical protein OFS07_15460 [Brachyspira hyodysenteriae]|uniref:hypothetical protein n=1 Tax=Brachyspira hyodysenteriae TaxID=159 RepID=UPI00063DBFE2|nr:hypothetical protein [Brachyspira hyodysenteriae]KLI17005.1 hypothetical protein SU45_06495 [Brachyspira hyodysenteriae]KLI30761.1 hypothetical protein SZ49_05600 [Brachyspira hyodysenteriae]KLI62477.1 hypothetical protein SZ46_01475 [Brachyspira hyodysenteriae]MDA0066688.1 hypothetical protein [Brachyspira hyodysenteriae]MDA0067656.1 hypothetical protein [Brachyspira hyodysenteriae]